MVEPISNETDNLTGIRIPLKKCAIFLKKLGSHLYNDESIPSVIPDENKRFENRILLLKKSIVDKSLQGLPEDLKEWISQQNDVSIIDYKMNKNENDNEKEEKLIKKILPDYIDSNIKKECLKQTMILNLEQDQLPYKEKIAEIIFKKSKNEIKSVLNKIVIKNNEDNVKKYFFEYKYELLYGEKNIEIDIEEFNCEYKFNLLEYYYDSSLQSERERIFTYFDQKDIICDLFCDLLLDVRMAKLNLNVMANINNNENLLLSLKENLNLNHIDEKNYQILDTSIFSYLRICFTMPFKSTNNYIKHIYISSFLRDLLFLNIFVGLFNEINIADHFKDEKNLPTIYFYYIIDLNVIKSKIKDHIIHQLNSEISIFKKDDIEEINVLNHIIENNKRILMIKLKLNSRILNADNSLIYSIINIEKEKNIQRSNFCGKRSASKELHNEINKEIDSPNKKVKKSASKELKNEEVQSPLCKTSPIKKSSNDNKASAKKSSTKKL